MSRLAEIEFERQSSREGANRAIHGVQTDDGLNGSLLLGSDCARGLYRDKSECRDDSLKDLLLANLDLIQNQQELLLANERTIQALRKENDMLKCRLDRIERRMSLVYQKDVHSLATVSSPAVSASPRHRSDARPTRATNRKLNLEVTDVGSEMSEKTDGALQRSDTEHDSKRKLEDTQGSVEDRTTQVVRTSPRKPGGKLASGKTRTSRRSEVQQGTSEVEVSAQKLSRLEEIKEKMDRKQERLSRRLLKNSELLMTETLYYVPPLYANVDDEDEVDVKTSCPDPIPVPSWRIKILSSLYVMEGTENLDDRVFLKRHQKSEAEEKRRKRWDIQRLKDLQLLRRQQLKDDVSSSARQDILTFLPQIDKALYVEVNDMIPVSAFGYPLPTVESQEFQLPWYSINKDHTNKNKKLRKI